MMPSRSRQKSLMKSLRLLPIMILCCLILFSVSFAQDKTASTEALTFKSTPIITSGYIFQLIISLLIVFGLMYLISKYILPKIKVSTKGRYIEIIDKVGLEPQVTAYILKIKDVSWLIVISNKNISTVSKLESF